MKLQGRNLSNGTRGDDVRLLHHELLLLGFRLIPDATEVNPGIFGPHTLVAVREFQEKAGLKVTGIVDEVTARAINDKVSGLPDGGGTGSPFRGAWARHHSRRLTRGRRYRAGLRPRSAQRGAAGQEPHRPGGRYKIRYSPSLRRSEKGSADLVVKASGRRRQAARHLARVLQSPPQREVDLTILAEALPPPTLFEKIRRELEPLLGDLKVEELEEDEQHQDCQFPLRRDRASKKRPRPLRHGAQAGAAGVSRRNSGLPCWADRFSSTTESQSLEAAVGRRFWTHCLRSMPQPCARRSLAAFNQKEIPEAFREKIDRLDRGVSTIRRQPTGERSGASRRLSNRRSKMPESRALKEQEKFARLFNEHKALTPELLEELEKDAVIQEEEIADLRTSFQLADLTQGDFSVVKMLKEEFEIRQPEADPHAGKERARASGWRWSRRSTPPATSSCLSK